MRLGDKQKPLQERKKQAYQFFLERGYTPVQSAGIVGNLIAESSLNHQAGKNDKVENSMGLAQWNAKGSPQRVEKFKQLYGKPLQESSFEEQLNYVDWELKNTEKKAFEKLQEATTADDAALVISKYYERPHRDYAHNDRRITNARNLLQTFEGMEFEPQKAQTQQPITTEAQIPQQSTVTEWQPSIFDENLTFYEEPKINRTFAPLPDVADTNVGENEKEDEESPAKIALDKKIAERNFLVGLLQQGAFNYVAPEYKRTNAFAQQQPVMQDGGKYTVQKGDNISTIAKRNNLTVADIIALNPSLKEDPNVIREGDKITLTAQGYDYFNDPEKLFKNQRQQVSRPIVDERNQAVVSNDAIINTFPNIVKEKGTALGDPNYGFEEAPVYIKYNSEEERRKKLLEQSKEIKTKVKNRQFDAGIKNLSSKEDIIKAQEFLKSKGYDLNPQGKFKNHGVDGKIGEVTKKAIQDYNKNISPSYYTGVKEGSGKLGECNEKQCSEYVQNEAYRNISPKMTRKEWNNTTGLYGDAWEIGKNIIDKGGIEVNPQNVTEGDVVTIYTGGFSDYQEQADKAGTGTTHTAIVDKVNPDGSYYILHNVHKRKGDSYQGVEYRDKVEPNGKVDGWMSFTVKKAYRPNYSGEIPDNVEIDKNIKLVKREDGYVKEEAKKFAEPINDPKIKDKFINYYNIDEKDYYTIAKAAIGILGQETNYGTNIKYSSGAKEIGATLAHLIGIKGDEVSQGPGSIKLDTNFEGSEKSVFGITKSNIDKPEKATVATMQKIVNDYKYFIKKGFSKEDSIYRAIMKYNGSLSAVSNGKTREEWAQKYDLDYPNKVLNFAADFNVEKDGNSYKTYLDELTTKENVLKWKKEVEQRSL